MGTNASAMDKRSCLGRDAGIGALLETYPKSAVAVVLTGGFLLRFVAAAGTYLNPDEAEHFMVADKPSAALAYIASLSHPHPPLFIMLLHFWRNIGTSELVLRVPSIVAGTLFCWLMFMWLTRVGGLAVGWFGLVLATFLPPLVALSAEVRNYAMLLMFLAATLYFLERALDGRRPRLLAISFAFLYLGMLTHYSALFFAVAIATYAALRIIEVKPAVPMKATWAAGQVATAGLVGILYATQLSRLIGSGAERRARDGWLRDFYFHSGEDHLLSFTIGRSLDVFRFMTAEATVGTLVCLLFAASIPLLLLPKGVRNKITAWGSSVASWKFAILLLVPFVLVCLAGILGKFPYGGTRHCAMLLIFGIAGLSTTCAALVNYRTSVGTAAMASGLVICYAFATPDEPGIRRSDQIHIHMDRTVQFVTDNVSDRDVLFLDNQAAIMLGHYLCRQNRRTTARSIPGFASFACGRLRVIATDYATPGFDAENFPGRWREMTRRFSLEHGAVVWVIIAGWGPKRLNLASELQTRSSEFGYINPHFFGHNIQVFALEVGRPSTAIAPIPHLLPP